MYDTLADSSRSSSSVPPLSANPRSPPSPTSVPGVRCRLALSSPLLSSPPFSSIVCQHCFDSSSSRGLFRSAHSSIGQVIFNPVARPFPASFLVSVYTQTRPLPLSMPTLPVSTRIPREDRCDRDSALVSTRPGYCPAKLETALAFLLLLVSFHGFVKRFKR